MTFQTKPSKPLQILIVEDEAIIAEDLRICLENLGYEIAGIAKTYDEGLQLLKSKPVDLILLDIILKGEKDGIALAAEVRAHHKIPFIFLTSHADKATVDRAKTTHPNAYLIKPFSEEDIYSAIEVAMTNFTGEFGDTKLFGKELSTIIKDSIFVKEGNAFVKLFYDDIHYLKSEGNYIHIFSEDAHHIIRSTQHQMLSLLGQLKFMRTHRSYLVNISKISAIYPTEVEIGDAKIPLQKDHREQLLSRVSTLS